MKEEIQQLYSCLETLSKRQLLQVLERTYSEKGLKNVVAYFLLEALDPEDSEEIDSIRKMFLETKESRCIQCGNTGHAFCNQD